LNRAELPGRIIVLAEGTAALHHGTDDLLDFWVGESFSLTRGDTAGGILLFLNLG
jgi:hypothetical protein